MTGFALIYAPLDSSGTGRGEERAPQALWEAGLLDAVPVDSVGDTRALIRDSRRDPETGVIGVGDLRRAGEAVAAAVSGALASGWPPLVIGGDCSILLGIFAALPGDAACGSSTVTRTSSTTPPPRAARRRTWSSGC